MFTKVLRKSLILLAVYAIFIIGIFVLQFKNSSIISEKIGSLHITLVESTDDNNTIRLKNKFSTSFNGISFSTSDDNPVKIVKSGKAFPVTLLSWKKESATSCSFLFTENLTLRFSMSDETPKALLNVDAVFPKSVSSVQVPFSLTGGATLTSLTDKKIQINSKKNTWELSASEIEDGHIHLNHKEPVISYAYYDNTRSFSFAMAAALENATETAYSKTVELLKDNLVQTFSQISPESTSVTEMEAVSYVAVMASRGKYQEGIEGVPQNFKKNGNRTYLSAPYFNNLAKMNESLVRQMQKFSDTITLASENGSLDVFTLKNLSDYMSMHPGSETIAKLLQNTASRDLSDITIMQAAGILTTWIELSQKNKTLADMLEPATKACVSKIESSCNLDDNTLTMVEKGTFLPVVNASYAGDAILRYGRLTNNAECVAGGRLIINSYLKNSDSFDSRSLAELYPIIVHDNIYYPHFVIMSFDKLGAVWAWTCAEKVSYINDNAGTISILVDFMLSNTHYMIVNGIEAFKSIYIYDMAFRTDPRFETYNSSGYVYQKDNTSLLLKSRHRSTTEVIRLSYIDNSAEKAASETSAASDSTENTESSEATTGTESGSTE